MTALFGVMAEFTSGAAVRAATLAARAAGYTALDVHSPAPVDGLEDALRLRARIAPATLLGGVLGGAAIFGFMVWAQAIDWTLDIGGRDPVAVPAFIVPAFELTILGAGLATFFALIFGARLPALYHPVFNVPAFERASQDRYFLVIEASDPQFSRDSLRALMTAHGALEVHDVPR